MPASMKKVLIYALDTAILLLLLWAFFLHSMPREFWNIVGVVLVAGGSLALLFAIKHRVDRRAQSQASAELETRKRVEAEVEQRRRERLAADREARRPVCVHCGKASVPRHQHRRTDGSADMRYRDNPLLCNRCGGPYQVIRPQASEAALANPPSTAPIAGNE